MNLDKVKDYIETHRRAIIACLIVLLLVMSFYAGSVFSCKEGILKGFKCVKPVNIGVVSFCELDAFNCVSKCNKYIVNNITAFCETYTINNNTFKTI